MTDDQLNSFLPIIHSGDPLLTKLMGSNAKTIHSYDIVNNINSIEDYITNEIQHLSTPSMYGEILTSRTLLFLALSPFGITEIELLDLLGNDSEIINFLKSTAVWKFDERMGIPKVVLYRFMSDVRSLVIEFNKSGDIIYKLTSPYYAETIRRFYNDDTVEKLYIYYKKYYKSKEVYLTGRKIDERIARQWMYFASKEDVELQYGLKSIVFCDACIKLGEIQFLIEGFRKLNMQHSRLYVVIMKNLNQLLVFNDMFLTYINNDDTCNVFHYKKIIFKNASNKIPQITNWMRDKIEFCHILSNNEYIITCENALLKIDRNNNQIVDKLVFNAQIISCKLSSDLKSLLIVCGIDDFENSYLQLFWVNTYESHFTINKDMFIKVPGSKPKITLTAYKKDFYLSVTTIGADFSVLKGPSLFFYRISDGNCSEIYLDKEKKHLRSYLFSNSIIDKQYLLLKIGLNKILIYDLENQQFTNYKKNIKISLIHSIVAEDGNTYDVKAGDGLYKIEYVHGRLLVSKVFSFFSKSDIEADIYLLKNCFLRKDKKELYADIYKYDGMYIGRVVWNGSDIAIEITDAKALFLDIYGGIYEKEIDSSIIYNQKKVSLSMTEHFFVGLHALQRLKTNSNCLRNKTVISNSGKYIACLTQNDLSVFQDGKLIFKYLYYNKYILSADIRFIKNDVIIWKQSDRKFKIIDLEKKMIRSIATTFQKNYSYVIDESSMQLVITSLKKVYKYKISDNGKCIKEIEFLKDKYETIETIDTLIKKKEVTTLFRCKVPSQLQFNELENDQILCMNDKCIVRVKNQKIYFYLTNKNLKLILSLWINEDENKSKISVYENVYYCYLEQLKMILIYNCSGKQTISYALNDFVTDVAFDKNTIRVLYKDMSIENIDVV